MVTEGLEEEDDTEAAWHLLQELELLRPRMAEAAQRVYDSWKQVRGMDEKRGTGGICDEIAEAIYHAIWRDLHDVSFFEGGRRNHAYLCVQREGVALGIDIPSCAYESGRGGMWTKKRGASFNPDHIVIFEVVPDE
jgi:hypothetical protein